MSASRRGRYPRHVPSVHWTLRRDLAEYLSTTADGQLELVLLDRGSTTVTRYTDGVGVKLDRRTARLLARRLLQCLDDTA